MAGSLFTTISFPPSNASKAGFALLALLHDAGFRQDNRILGKYKTTVLRPSSRGRGETGGRAYGGGFWNPGTAQVPLSSALLSIVVCAGLGVLYKDCHGK
jgi:hypothetical protein